MKKFFVTVLCIAVAAIAGYGIKYALTPVNTQEIEYTTHENSVSGEGYVIREEWLMTARNEGTFYHAINDGDRIKKDGKIGELFYGDVSEERLQELAVADSRIKNAQESSISRSMTAFDSANVEGNIFNRESDIVSAAADNDVLSISKYKKDINSLRKNNTLASEDTLTELEARREEILREIGVSKEEIIAQISGALSMYTDGYEDSLVLSDMANYSVAYYDSLPKQIKIGKISNKVDVGGAVCKVVNNHRFYIMTAVPTEQLKGRQPGTEVKIRFKNMANVIKNGVVHSISEDQGGRSLLIVQCTDYLENALSYRLADVDIIFESYTGYKIPVSAIRTEDTNKQKVIGVKNGVERDCYFDLVYTYTDGGYAIVRPADDSIYKLSDMDRIVVGER